MKKSIIFSLSIFFIALSHISGQTLTQKLYLDFGKSDDVNGNITAGADRNGNYWNNIVSDEDGSPSSKAAGYIVELINSFNENTGFVLETTRLFQANGKNNGSLLNPNPAFLGDLAIATATEDYFFLDNNRGDKGAFVLKNLNPAKVYKFYVFGCCQENTVRTSIFSISGANGSHGTLQTSGSNIGAEIANGNDNTIFVSGFVAPKANGEILFELGILTGGYAYINAMKIEEYDGYSIFKAEKKFYIDFGKNNDGLDGSLTESPDVNGNYWNNIYDNGDAGVPAGTSLNIVFSDNSTGAYVLETGSSFPFNGVRNGGLTDPDPALLNDLAIATATEDFLYVGDKGSLLFKKLNTNKMYRFSVFGSRNETENRIGIINIAGSSSVTGIHQMSGRDMCGPGVNQNIKNIFVSDPVTPNREGTITLEITKWLGAFIYINAIKVEELSDAKWATALTVSGNNISSCGQPMQMDVAITPVNTFCPVIKWSVDNEDIARITEGGKLYPRQDGVVIVTATATFADRTFISDSKEITISNQVSNDYSLTIMGSSTPAGTGAAPGKGYADLLAQWLSQNAEYTWTTKNISIGGDNTTRIINRWESDLLPACSRYVYYGLTLGNEGIQETGQTAFNSYRDNMLLLIERTREVGKVPVMGNTYMRGDFNETDYNYTKQLDLLIHQWDVPSVNLLGALDDGNGRWALGYQADGWHPNTEGHAEMFYVIVPSLFDALADGKPQPKRVDNTFILLKKDDEKQITWSPENVMHSFTLSFSFKTTSTGTVASFINENLLTGALKINDEGRLVYETQSTDDKLTSSISLNNGQWHQVSLTHYYARGATFLYVDGVQVEGRAIPEKLVPTRFYLNDFKNALESVAFRELFLHRAGMNADEIQALHAGKMLKSSLEIYAPLDGNAATEQEALENLAQSLNTLTIKQKEAIPDFETLNYLYEISGTKTLAGQNSRQYWRKMQQIAGDYPAVWGEDMLYYPSNGTGSMTQWRELITHDAKQRWIEGAVISMMFHACPPTESEPCDWRGRDDTGVLGTLSNEQWQELITDGTTLNRNWKARLDAIYPYLKELDDAGVELLFRPLHEMNQGAFWWGGRPGTNGTAKLYQITRDYLEKTKNLTNLIWVWNVQDFSTLTEDLKNYDPGRDYWDVLSLDIYGSDGQGYTTSKYNLLKNKAEGRPIAIGECDVLPSSVILASQPDWTFFMGWNELTQQKNSDATIYGIYNASNVLTLNQRGKGIGTNNNQDTLIVCDFDDYSPFISTGGGLRMDYADASGGSSASGQMGVVRVPDNNGSSGGNFFAIWIDGFIDPRDYVGISFLAQAQSAVPFAAKLEQSLASNDIAQIQDWNSDFKYAGNGEWQEVRISFDKIKENLTAKLAASSVLNPADYDRIVIVPAPYQNRPEFTLNIDNIRLRTFWGDTGIKPAGSFDTIILVAENGTIRAKAGNGDSVSLKAYSLSGQEIATGINQLRLGTKGVYIIKATTGSASKVSKIVIQ